MRDQSRRPHSHPKTTPSEVVEKILYLHRYHAITLSRTAVWRVLKRAVVAASPPTCATEGGRSV